MRWLTRHWEWEAEEDERARVWSEYQAHLKPLDHADFAQSDPQYNHRLWIHDSLMDRVIVNRALGRISLRLLQGDDPPIGNGLLTMIFEDAEFVEGSADELVHWITATDTDSYAKRSMSGPGRALGDGRLGSCCGRRESSPSRSRTSDTNGPRSS
jgi:hypothetical protein